MADEIHRIVKQRDYVVIDKRMFHNDELSWKAKGIMGYVLTLPDDWTFRLEEIITHSKDKRDSFRAGWKELQEHGYVKRIAVRDEKGLFSHWETHVFECPTDPINDNPYTENPLMDDNTAINGKSASTNGKSSDWKNQTLDFPTLLSIDSLLSIDITNSSSATDMPTQSEMESEKFINDTYTKVFGPLQQPPIFREYILTLRSSGMSDETICEAMLEAAESASGRPNQKFFAAIVTRWMDQGIKSREEAKQRKTANVPIQRRQYNRQPERSKPDIVPATPPPATESSTVSQSEYEEAMELARMMDQSK